MICIQLQHNLFHKRNDFFSCDFKPIWVKQGEKHGIWHPTVWNLVLPLTRSEIFDSLQALRIPYLRNEQNTCFSKPYDRIVVRMRLKGKIDFGGDLNYHRCYFQDLKITQFFPRPFSQKVMWKESMASIGWPERDKKKKKKAGANIYCMHTVGQVPVK